MGDPTPPFPLTLGQMRGICLHFPRSHAIPRRTIMR